MDHPFQGLEPKGPTNRGNPQKTIPPKQIKPSETVSGRVCVLKSWCILDHSRKTLPKRYSTTDFSPKIWIKRLLEIFWIWVWPFFPLSFLGLIWTSPFFSRSRTVKSTACAAKVWQDAWKRREAKPWEWCGSGWNKKTQSKQVLN